MTYEARFPWAYCHDDNIVINHDGSASVMITWDGITRELKSQDEVDGEWSNLYILLDSLDPKHYRIEFHAWREQDARLAVEYLDRSKDFIRAKEICEPMREAHAYHLAQYAMSNQLAVVITRLRKKKRLFAKKHLSDSKVIANQLAEELPRFMRLINGARLATCDEFFQKIVQSSRRKDFDNGRLKHINKNYFINEQVISTKPHYSDGLLKVDDTYQKVMYVFLTPDADYAGYMSDFMGLPANLHITTSVMPLDKKKVVKGSENATNREEGFAGNRGEEERDAKLIDEKSFRRHISNNPVKTFASTLIIKVFGDKESVYQQSETIKDFIDRRGGQVRDSEEFQLVYYRFSLPGCGYQANHFRVDDTWQVANLIPAQSFEQGTRHPDMLRLGSSGQLIGESFDNDTVNHSFTVAMTGAGKGVDKCCQIFETYPFGIDWYIMEVGRSYEWVVEALGGRYLTIDPRESIVQPLPSLSVCELTDDGYVLPFDVITGTIGAISFLLTGGRTQLNDFEKVIAQNALELTYLLVDRESPRQPILEDFMNALDVELAENEKEVEAAQSMRMQLESFLRTKEGSIFNQEGNMDLSGSIIGVDLLQVKNIAPDLMKFYLVFLSLAFTQKAFASKTPSRVLLDEMHVYVQIAPDVVGPLCSGLARMGRKDAASLDLVTQEVAEIDAIESAVVNQCNIKSILYRQGSHDEVAQRLGLNQPVIERWMTYPNPKSLNYRQGIKVSYDKVYDQHLTFEKKLLLAANTDPQVLDLKNTIGKRTDNFFERLDMLDEAIKNAKDKDIREAIV